MIDAGSSKNMADEEAKGVMNGKWPYCLCGSGNEILFEWDVPKDYPNFSGYDDIAEAYRVVENKIAASGIVVHSKYHGKWSVHNQSCRPLIRYLVSLIKTENE